METCTAEPHESVPDLQDRNPCGKPPSPTIDDNADKDIDLDAALGTQNGDGHHPRLKKSSVRVRLGGLSDLRIHTDAIDFTSSQPHGCGGKAEVAKATLKKGDGSGEQEVAVKRLRYYDDINDRKFGNEFVHEVEMLAQLSHNKIVKLIGFVEDLQEGKAWIVLSWEPNGNVSEFLATGEWEIPERISLIQDIFSGLGYLHTRQPPICHGDLKSLNVLVSASSRAIITDFGSARIVSRGQTKYNLGGVGETEDRQEDQDEARDVTEASAIAPVTDERVDRTQITIVASSNQLTLTGPAWSLRWAAPEVVLGEPQNLASDIWAAGWICWEVMTNKVPFPELNSEGAIVLEIVQGQVPAVREDTQLGQIARLCSLMTDCWAFDPQNRPNISQCESEVQWMPSIPPLKGKVPHSKALSAKLLYKIGLIHDSQGNSKEAISAFQQALSAARSAGDQKSSQIVLQRLGGIYHLTGNGPKAKQYLTQAQDICTQLGDDRGLANALYKLGNLYHAQCKSTLAEESFTRSGNIFSRIGDDRGRAKTLFGLGNVLKKRTQYTEAEECYNQARSIYAALNGDSRSEANILRRLGTLSYELSEYVKAEELLIQALDIYHRIGDNLGLANTKRNLGHVYRVQGLNAKMALLFAEARRLYVRIGDSESEKNCSDWLDVVSKEGYSMSISLSVPGNDDVPSPAPQQ